LDLWIKLLQVLCFFCFLSNNVKALNGGVNSFGFIEIDKNELLCIIVHILAD